MGVWHERRVVQCHGCFDPLHLGHIRHFEAAKAAGDYLVVSVTPDKYVNKGAGRPVFTQEQRAEAIRALSCVDEVLVTSAPTAAEAIKMTRPDIFAKGSDYKGGICAEEEAALAEVGGTLLITETEKFSSTALLSSAGVPNTQSTRVTPSGAVSGYLSALRARYSYGEVLAWLGKAEHLRVLVIGDAIRDEYHYCDSLGKSGKDPMPAVHFRESATFAGGGEAVFQHVSAVADRASFVTGPVTVKRRFIERYPFVKLFEVYEMDEAAGNAETPRLLDILPAEIAKADVVIVADYGHGLLTPPVIALVSDAAKFLAVNTQANAGNHGFNTISKYRRADFISLSEREIRLDARDQRRDVTYLAGMASWKHDAKALITRGEKGCIAVSAGLTPDIYASVEAPALTTHTVDRTGAGDAVFAITACCAAVGMPLDLLTFMASVVGTQAVGIVGNARYIERQSLRASIQELLA